MESTAVLRPSRWSPRRRAGALGAVSAVAGLMVALIPFYPLGRVFDPTTGGDEPTALITELAIGGMGAVFLSPVAAALGAAIGRRRGARTIDLRVTARLVGLSVTLAISLFALLNGGLIDESGSVRSLLFVITLGTLAGATAVAVFRIGRNIAAVE